MTEKIMVELNTEDVNRIIHFDRLTSDNSLGKLHCARDIQFFAAAATTDV